MSILKNIKYSDVLELKNLVDYAEGQVVSKTLIQNDGLGITLSFRREKTPSSIGRR